MRVGVFRFPFSFWITGGNQAFVEQENMFQEESLQALFTGRLTPYSTESTCGKHGAVEKRGTWRPGFNRLCRCVFVSLKIGCM